MTAIKVGDKVRAVKKVADIRPGDIGTVKIVIDGWLWPYYVDFGYGGVTLFDDIDGVSVHGLSPCGASEVERVEAAA